MPNTAYQPTLPEALAIIAGIRSNPCAVLELVPPPVANKIAARLSRPVRVEWNGRFTWCAGRAQWKEFLIELSPNHGWTRREFADTVLHEYAHVLTYGLDRSASGQSRRHGALWRLVHINMGGSGKRCHALPLVRGVRRRQRRVWIRCVNLCWARRPVQSAATNCVRHHICNQCRARIVRTDFREARRCRRVVER